ncbi:MAG: hypothetical protein IKV36_02690 [Clostridia bacterium]|nr:hypothetical protein [Clostridia bacterium]MBR6509909.1 hypothetical protein [Clostridia bacterium]
MGIKSQYKDKKSTSWGSFHRAESVFKVKFTLPHCRKTLEYTKYSKVLQLR